MVVALARVAEAALRRIELGLRGIELRGGFTDRALERRDPTIDLLPIGLEGRGFLAVLLRAAPQLAALIVFLRAIL